MLLSVELVAAVAAAEQELLFNLHLIDQSCWYSKEFDRKSLERIHSAESSY